MNKILVLQQTPALAVEKETNKAGDKKEKNKSGQIQICKEKLKVSWKKERGHLFVPSCVAKSLTKAILNDIGESLQSEELQGVRGKEERKESKERWGSFYVKRKEGGKKGLAQTLGAGIKAARPCKLSVRSCISANTLNKCVSVCV